MCRKAWRFSGRWQLLTSNRVGIASCRWGLLRRKNAVTFPFLVLEKEHSLTRNVRTSQVNQPTHFNSYEMKWKMWESIQQGKEEKRFWLEMKTQQSTYCRFIRARGQLELHGGIWLSKEGTFHSRNNLYIAINGNSFLNIARPFTTL